MSRLLKIGAVWMWFNVAVAVLRLLNLISSTVLSILTILGVIAMMLVTLSKGMP